MVTVPFLPTMSRMKTFHYLLRILRGPLYGGINGPLTVSARIHTWAQVCRSICWKEGRFAGLSQSRKHLRHVLFQAINVDRRIEIDIFLVHDKFTR